MTSLRNTMWQLGTAAAAEARVYAHVDCVIASCFASEQGQKSLLNPRKPPSP
jgi:hypothetical protein